jgi:two-component system chemotaxis sensor kinase CheA
MVDRVGDTAEIVVKPLDRALKALGVYAGATITGDGRVALILDLAGLGRRAMLTVSQGEAMTQSLRAQAFGGPEVHRLLVVQTLDDGRAAIPLDGVDRLEEIPARQIQRVGDQEVVRYRGTVLPLVRLSSVLREKRSRPRRAERLTPIPRELLSVVVHRSTHGPVGVVVERVLDIVQVPFADTRPPSRLGVRFSLDIQERVTEVLDMAWVVGRAAGVEGSVG